MHFDQHNGTIAPGGCTEHGFMRGKRAMECVGCSQPTCWFHREVLLYFCSDECFQRYQGESVDRKLLNNGDS